MQFTQTDSAGVFCAHGPRAWQPVSTGVLAGVRLAVKDVFAVQGVRNSAGNPDWHKHAKVAEQTAPVVQALLDQGCQFEGLTHTDELAYSLEGNNIHYGAAQNPKARGYACGGSSMGSAAAVAGDLADIGLGTDTGGSIRVPASYCGLYGVRPSHGVVDTTGLVPLAPPFDTVGWFSRSSALLEQVGDLLLPAQPQKKVTRLVVCEDLWSWLHPALVKLLQDQLEQCAPYFDRVDNFKLPSTDLLNQLADCFRVLQGRAIAKQHGQWFVDAKPNMADAIRTRFNMALSLTEAQEKQALGIQQQWQACIDDNLNDQSCLFLPTTPSTAPKIGADTSQLRMQILGLTAMAGLAGAAQVHLPVLSVPAKQDPAQALPYGFSLLMHSGSDRSLLSLCHQLDSRLKSSQYVGSHGDE